MSGRPSRQRFHGCMGRRVVLGLIVAFSLRIGSTLNSSIANFLIESFVSAFGYRFFDGRHDVPGDVAAMPSWWVNTIDGLFFAKLKFLGGVATLLCCPLWTIILGVLTVVHFLAS